MLVRAARALCVRAGANVSLCSAQDLAGTRVSGTLPSSVANWTSLGAIDLSGSRLSGTLDASLARWSRLVSLDFSRTSVSGSVDVALQSWSLLQYLSLAHTLVSGTLPSTCMPAASFTEASFANTRLTGTVPDCVWAMKLALLDLSSCQLTGLASNTSVLSASGVMAALLPNNNISYSPALCPGHVLLDTLDLSGERLAVPASLMLWPSVARVHSSALHCSVSSRVISVPACIACPHICYPPLQSCSHVCSGAGNPWHGVDVTDAVRCFAAEAVGMYVLILDNMGLVGALNHSLGLPTPPSLGHLSLRGNSISSLIVSLEQHNVVEQTAACAKAFPNTPFGECPLAYGLIADLNTLHLDNNPLLDASISLDMSYPFQTVSASNTSLTYCYEGYQLASAGAVSRTLRNVRPATTCNRAAERDASTSLFGLCSNPPAAAAVQSAALNSTFCRQPSRVVFGNAATSLDCPAWSTYQTGGKVVLDVDAAWLRFWGCYCPPGTYWGYPASRLDLARAEAYNFSVLASLGEQERVLSARNCEPCPSGLDCNQLTVPQPPHQAVGSVYPYFAEGEPCRKRALLPYAAALLPCLHPAVCNQPSPDVAALLSLFSGRVGSWESWPEGQKTGVAKVGAAFSEVQCREGHDPASALCGSCVEGYWADGFLCQPCVAGAAVLVSLAAVAAVVGLALYLKHRVTVHVQSSRFLGQTTTIVLWYFQMSGALQLSAQLNRGRSSQAQPDSSSVQVPAVLDWLQPLLSFRFWAAECLVGSAWNFKLSSAVLLSLPFILPPMLVFRSDVPRTAAVLLSDLMFLPVTQRALQWFNHETHDALSLVRLWHDTLRVTVRASLYLSCSAYRVTCRTS